MIRASHLIIVPLSAAGVASADDEALPHVTVGGYVETYYQAHFQNPSNRITNLRGFDNRSRTFTLDNVALDVKAEKGPVTVHVIAQVGATPSTYYLVEPALLGTSSVNATGPELWKYLQAANVSAKLPCDWVLEAGLFPSPIGPEVIPIRDNMNWSRSNLFFALPFYHTGATIAHPFGEGWTAKLAAYNGWNSVVDNNGFPSVALSAGYQSKTITAQLMYFGGIERPSGAPEGKPWRNLFDALGQWAISDKITIAGQADAGFELNDIGTSWWAGFAAYVKYSFDPTLYLALRGDYFHETVPDDAGLFASSIFFPTPWVTEGTLTLAYQPVDTVSVRLEYRHDQADDEIYFGGDVAIDAMTLAFIPNRHAQDTLLVGATAWF